MKEFPKTRAHSRAALSRGTEHQQDVSVQQGQPKQSQRGWRSTVRIWMFVTLMVCVVNVTFLIWTETWKTPRQRYDSSPGKLVDSGPNKLLYEGDCSKASGIKNAVHLAINILSSLLLVASANCMQCLSSPTRDEVDKAHGNRQFLNIGVMSAHNIKKIRPIRATLWLVLALSSIPLHLFYNSVVFSSASGNEVPTYLVSENFSPTLNASCNPQQSHQTWSNMSCSETLSFSNATWRTLQLSECLGIFGSSIVSQYKSLALVTNFTREPTIIQDPVVFEPVGFSQPWTCFNDQTTYPSAESLLMSCDFERNPQKYPVDDEPSSLFPNSVKIDHCIAVESQEHCTIEAATSLLGIVIAMNVVKATVMFCTYRFLNFEPLVTVGDGMRSFLEKPDLTTSDYGPITYHQLSRTRPGSSYLADPSGHYRLLRTFEMAQVCDRDRHSRWRNGKRRLFTACRMRKWTLAIGLCLLTECVAAVMLKLSTEKGTIEDSKSLGFGNVNGTFYATIPGLPGLGILSILCNLPQLIVSCVYMFYYSLFSSLLTAKEISRFSIDRKPLRVSPPQHGQQRATYWLSVPFRYALSLMTAMTLLHWLISQSLFVTLANQCSIEGGVSYHILDGLGFSPIAIIASMAWGGVIILFPLLLGLTRLPSGIPNMGHNSLAISAACHPDKKDLADIASKPIMYGVLPTRGETGRRRVGFSSLSTEPLVDGEVYERLKCLASLGVHAHDCHLLRAETIETAVGNSVGFPVSDEPDQHKRHLSESISTLVTETDAV